MPELDGVIERAQGSDGLRIGSLTTFQDARDQPRRAARFTPRWWKPPGSSPACSFATSRPSAAISETRRRRPTAFPRSSRWAPRSSSPRPRARESVPIESCITGPGRTALATRRVADRDPRPDAGRTQRQRLRTIQPALGDGHRHRQRRGGGHARQGRTLHRLPHRARRRFTGAASRIRGRACAAERSADRLAHRARRDPRREGRATHLRHSRHGRLSPRHRRRPRAPDDHAGGLARVVEPQAVFDGCRNERARLGAPSVAAGRAQ